ncbi:Protein KRI1 [Talaromyces islandicus]|uniref:Protein KRI1 n=1 Tax=Talaromyces islandicus TaxID=28573 RepID=A0A0U1LQR6_TALIS|nr:Protein KRI1 [Talaromyces islandicus]
MEPPAKRSRKIFEDSGSESEDDSQGGVAVPPESGFKINQEYARRFEYNKKREERQQLEAKLGKTSSLGKRKQSDPEGDYSDGSEESSEEDEDEDGELATEALDSEIMNTLNAIRSKDPRVYDTDVKFYSEITEDQESANQPKKEKPMYLRDYHRQNLLNGDAANGDEETPKTFAQEQEDLKKNVIREMHAAANDDDDDEDDFLVAKSKPELDEDAGAQSSAQLDVEHANEDPEKFLSEFLSTRAWIPTKSSKFQPFESDDEEQEQKAEEFEEAYNFRFEDPRKINEKLLTHARDTTNQMSVRREDTSSRKKKREAEQQKKEAEKRERESQKNRLRKLKMEELEDKVKKIKQAAGLKAAAITEDEWVHFLDENWNDEEWEKEMAKRFGDEYYAAEDMEFDDNDNEDEAGSKKKRRPKKPTWDDDIDIKDLVPDFDDEAEPGVTLSDEDIADGGSGEEDEDEEGSSKKKKKSRTQEKHEQKRSARKERRLLEEAVDRNLELDPTLLPGATKKNSSHFRYRETSPQSFGLTARDILMADDSQLNQFVGLKKLASFRDAERKRRDQKKMGKKSRLRQWRKDTFGAEEEPEFKLAQGPAPGKEEKGDEMEVDIREGGSRKKRKRSRKH